MTRKKLALAVVAAALAAGTPAAALAASTGTNSGRPADRGNCFGNFVNGGSQGSNVSNSFPGAARPTDLGQFIGVQEHGCR